MCSHLIEDNAEIRSEFAELSWKACYIGRLD